MLSVIFRLVCFFCVELIVLIRSIKVMTCCLIINVINAQPANVTPNQHPSVITSLTADETGVNYRVTEQGIFNIVFLNMQIFF